MGACVSSQPINDGNDKRPRTYSTEAKGFTHLQYLKGPLTNEEIISRIESSQGNLYVKMGDRDLICAYLTQRGYYPDDLEKDNQDCLSCDMHFGEFDDQVFAAVYDGHGKDGHRVAQYCRDELPQYLKKELNLKVKALQAGGESAKSRVKLPDVDILDALRSTHLKCNSNLRSRTGIAADLSGSTSVSVFIVEDKVYCSNVGDSRAILISETEDGNVSITPFSNDQTPYRKDERDRVRKFGARILSMDQMEGLEPVHDNWDNLTLGEDIDVGGDPPRIWHPKINAPGTAFTRSIGDFFAETLGVVAEPEIFVHTIDKKDKYIVLASDGVFEFLTNRSVADIVMKSESAMHACQLLAKQSYELWLKEEVRTDDITAIVIKIKQPINVVKSGLELMEDSLSAVKSINPLSTLSAPPSPVAVAAPTTPEQEVQKKNPETDSPHVTLIEQKDEQKVPATSISPPIVPPSQRRRRKSVVIRSAPEDSSQDFTKVALVSVPKSEEDVAVINAAMGSNFLFMYTSEEQRKIVTDVMQPLSVKAGDFVITQGQTGAASEHFYVVKTGRYEVRVNGVVVHTYVGDIAQKMHPGFGELSLLYDKPRAASVVALEDAELFSLNRRIFKEVVTSYSDASHILAKMIRITPALKCLRPDQVQVLSEMLCLKEMNCPAESEETFNGLCIIGAGLVKMSNLLATFGSSDSLSASTNVALDDNIFLKAGQCIGTASLLSPQPENGVYKLTMFEPTRLWRCSREEFESTFGATLQKLQEQYEAESKRQRLPSPTAPTKISHIKFDSLISTTDISRMLNGSINIPTMEKAEPLTVSIRTFVTSEVDSLQRQSAVLNWIQALRLLSVDARAASCAFVPKLMSVYSEKNAVYLLYDQAMTCDLRTLICRSDSEAALALDMSVCAVYVMSCIVQALQVIHAAGIAYRNLHFEGVIVDESGRVCLEDFSSSKVGGVGCKSFTVCGEMNYMSPEQLIRRGYDESVDLWALGVFLYEFVTGELPFAAKNEIATYSKMAAFASDPDSHSFAYDSENALHMQAKGLISTLLISNPLQRLRGDALISHPFFAHADWKCKRPSPLAKTAKAILKDLEQEGMGGSSTMLALFDTPSEHPENHWSSNLL